MPQGKTGTGGIKCVGLVLGFGVVLFERGTEANIVLWCEENKKVVSGETTQARRWCYPKLPEDSGIGRYPAANHLL